MNKDHSNVEYVRRKKKGDERAAALPIGSSRGHQMLAVSCAVAAKATRQKTRCSPLRPVLSTDLRRNIKNEASSKLHIQGMRYSNEFRSVIMLLQSQSRHQVGGQRVLLDMWAECGQRTAYLNTITTKASPALFEERKINNNDRAGQAAADVGFRAKRALTEHVSNQQRNTYQRLLKPRLHLTKPGNEPILGVPTEETHLEREGEWRTKAKENSDYLGENKENQDPVTDLIGMVNLGNTCYLNAVLQSLYRIKPLSPNVLRVENEVNSKSHKLLGALNSLREELNRASNKRESVNPLIVKEAISQRLAQFAGWSQQDAHECLLCILDILHEEYCQQSGHPRDSAITPVSTNFKIMVEHKFVCLQCSDVSIRTESHYALSLDLFLHQSSASEIMQEAHQSFRKVISTLDMNTDSKVAISSNNPSARYQLDQLIDEYMRDRRLERNCEHCASTQCRALHQFKSLPEVLTLHLKRFQMEISTDGEWRIAKDKSKVLIPHSLRIGPNATHYNLSSVIEHHGPTPNSGHYIYDWLSAENDWYRFDDEKVTKLSEQTSGDEYLVFYLKAKSI